MLILPISHEDQRVHRLPWVTIGLIALNAVAFLVVLPAAHREVAAVRARADELIAYVRAHPYLNLPAELAVEGEPAELPADLPDATRADQQTHLERLMGDLREAIAASSYRAYGYIPARPRLTALVTSLFMHGGWLHLIGNMLFLWLAAPSLEDRWGRGPFLAFYLVSGVVANLAHMALNPQSTIPVVGASGAIAGLMGAFLVRLGNTRIRFFYWVFILGVGTFSVRAYFVLPFWFAKEVMTALSGEAAGVAVGAHIGGFLLGAVVCLVLRASGLEARALAPGVERKITWTPSERLASTLERLDRGDVAGASRALEALLREHPDDIDARMALVSAYARQGDRPAAGRESARIVGQHLRARDLAGALIAYREHVAAYHDVPLPLREQAAVAAHCERIQEHHEAAEIYRNALATWPDEPLTPAALLAYGRLRLRVFRRSDEALDLFLRARGHPHALPEIRRAAGEELAAAGVESEPLGPATRILPAPPPPPAPAPSEGEPDPAPPAAARSPRLVAVPMRAVGVDARGLHLQDRRGATGLLAWPRVVAIAVGRIAAPDGAEADAGAWVLDVLTAPRAMPAGAEVRCARVAMTDVAIPQLQAAASPRLALHRLAAAILEASPAAAYPNREACVGQMDLPPYSDLGAFEADTTARLAGGG